MEDIQRITLTGGPCGGKTQSAPFVIEAGKEEGFTAFFEDETATEMIRSGLLPGITISLEKFQKEIYERQDEKDKRIIKYAKEIESDRVMIVCDRDFGDGLVYQEEDKVEALLREKGLTKQQVINKSQNIIHFITIAKDIPKLFDFQGRLETVKEACRLDDALLDLYSSVSNRIILYNLGSLEDKQQDAKLATKTFLRNNMRRIIIRKEAAGALDKLDLTPTTEEDGCIRFIVREGIYTYILGIYQDGSFMRTLDIMKNTPIPKWVLDYEEISIPKTKKLLITNH